MGPRPRFYKVTIVSVGQPWGVARTDRQISLKARSRLKNGSGRAAEHPTPILAVEKVACNAAATFGSSPSEAQTAELRALRAVWPDNRRLTVVL
jgi:hypothetical protein